MVPLKSTDDFCEVSFSDRTWTLFCHKLEADVDGFLVAYHLRMPNQKKEAVQRFKELQFQVMVRFWQIG